MIKTNKITFIKFEGCNMFVEWIRTGMDFKACR